MRTVPFAQLASERQNRECLACVYYDDNPRVATVSLADNYTRDPGGALYPVQTLAAHEVAHILLGPLENVFATIKGWLSADDRRSYGDAFQEHLETLLDTLATGLTGMRAVQVWSAMDLPDGWEEDEED